MKNILKPGQKGFAIIEALIAFLLLGIGVAALIYLQGNLMSGSSTSKARAEAMELAKNRTEVLRNSIDKRQYLSALRSAQQAPDEEVIGVNAKYSVCYNVVTNPSIPIIPSDPTSVQIIDLLKVPVNLGVIVKWPGIEGDAVTCSAESSKDEKITLETMLYFIKPEIVATIADQNDGVNDESDFPLPSPWITGVQRSHETTGKNDDEEGSPAEGYIKDSVYDSQELISIDEDGDVTFGGATADIEIITYSNPTTGLSNVEVVHGTKSILVDGVLTDVPDVKLTSFGGIVHKLKGEIILHHDSETQLIDVIENFHLLASPPSYCVAPICNDVDGTCKIFSCEDVVDGTLCNNEIPTGESVQYISYVCYVPGDCTNGDEDGDDTKGCPVPFNPPPDKNLNGGWYGRIGNFNLFLNKEKDMVCTADAPDNLTPSREYVTHRWENRDPDDTTSEKFIAGNEGINRPFDCDPDYDPEDPESVPNNLAFSQVFIIAGKVPQSTACIENAAEYIAGASSLFLPPENVIRIIGENTAIPASLSPIPYLHQPLDDLNPPYTVTNVVRKTHKEHCVPAP